MSYSSWGKETVILDDTFNQSRNYAALAAAGYVVHDGTEGSGPVGSAISEDGSALSLDVPITVASNWFNGDYTAARLEYTLPIAPASLMIQALVEHGGAINEQGAALIATENTDANFIQIQRKYDGAQGVIEMLRGPDQPVGGAFTTAVQAKGWVSLLLQGRTWFYGYDNTNPAGDDPPGITDMTFDRRYSPAWDTPVPVTAIVAGFHYTAKPALVAKIYRLKISMNPA